MSLSSAPSRGSKEMESFEYDPTISRPSASLASASGAAAYDTALATASRAYAASLKPEDEHALVSEPFDPKLAFQVFAGNVYAPSSSTSPAPAASSASVVAATTSAHAISSFETPQERLVRLKRDVAAFKAELAVLTARQQAAEAAATPTGGSKSAPLAIASNIQSELDALAADLASPSTSSATAAASAAGNTGKDAGAALASSLSTLTVGSPAAVTGSPAAAPASSSKGVGASTSDALVTADLRLARLEALLGTTSSASATSSSSSSSTAGTGAGVGGAAAAFPYPDLCTALASLGQQIEALDAGRIERVVRRVRGLAAEVEALGVKRQQAAEAAAKARAAAAAAAATAGGEEGAAKTSTAATATDGNDDDEDGSGSNGVPAALRNIHATIQKWDSIADTVPALVARLQSLKSVHSEAAQAVARAASISARHAEAEAEALEGKAAVAALTEAVEENAKVMGGNVLVLQERMKELSEKVDRLLSQG